MTRAALATAGAIAGVVLLSCGCGASQRAAPGQTTVQRYDIYPADTISVPTTNPESLACRHDAVGLARSSAQFVAHNGPASVYPADLYYVLMREELADFGARRCDAKLLGNALVRRLTPPQRRVLLTHAPHPMDIALRQALAAAGG